MLALLTSYAPSSPDEANSDWPCAAAWRNSVSYAFTTLTVVARRPWPTVTADCESNHSQVPQLEDRESTVLSLIAFANASTKPWSVFGAWYTMIFAPGATPPDCCTSSVDSSEPESSLGAPGPPSMSTTLMRLASVTSPSAFQYVNA